MAKPALLVDAGALIALVNVRDQYHGSISGALEGFFGELVTTWPAVAEACHILPDHLGPPLLGWLSTSRWRTLGMERAAPRVRELMLKYADRPMDLADASMIWAAEQTGVRRILTTDRTDFEIYRTKSGQRLEILP
jgi:predicted nucleic acid-binding protein